MKKSGSYFYLWVVGAIIVGGLIGHFFPEFGVKLKPLGDGFIVQLGNPPNRIDLLTSITGVSFTEAWESRVPGTLGGNDVYYLGLDALLANTTASGRDSDAADVEKLRSRWKRND